MDLANKPALSVASHGPSKPSREQALEGVFKTGVAMQERFLSFCSRG